MCPIRLRGKRVVPFWSFSSTPNRAVPCRGHLSNPPPLLIVFSCDPAAPLDVGNKTSGRTLASNQALLCMSFIMLLGRRPTLPAISRLPGPARPGAGYSASKRLSTQTATPHYRIAWRSRSVRLALLERSPRLASHANLPERRPAPSSPARSQNAHRGRHRNIHIAWSESRSTRARSLLTHLSNPFTHIDPSKLATYKGQSRVLRLLKKTLDHELISPIICSNDSWVEILKSMEK